MKNNSFKRYWTSPLEISWPTAVFGLRGPSAREGKMAQRASAHGLARPALALAWWRGSAMRPAAISGHGRASWRAHVMREETASAVG